MLEKEIVKVASENKIASDNTIKNSLIEFDIDFSGLKEAVALFFPSIRHEVVLRYRAETIAKIGIEAYKIAQNENIQINPIPPKIALPLIEKMSLEYEQDMYEKWAKLLIATGVNPNPIHQQYADILANINNENASLLKRIYEKQKSPNAEDEYDEYFNQLNFKECYDKLKRYSSRHISIMGGKNESALPDSSRAIYPFFTFPLILNGTEKTIDTYTSNYENGKAVINEDIIYIFSKKNIDNLIGLEKLGLIKYRFLYNEHKWDEDKKSVSVKRCGILLTQFGYSFVDCLEHPTK